MTSRISTPAFALLLAAGALPAAAQGIPNLVGTWKGTTEAVHVGPNPYRTAEGPGATFSSKPIEFTYTITKQQDNRFAGEMSGGALRETLIGAIHPDNKSGVMLDNDGHYQLTFRDTNTIDMCYHHLNPTSRVVTCWTLTRSRQ